MHSDPHTLKAATLRPEVRIEPLTDRWYTWPHLLGPATQALNLVYRYIPAAESFVQSPEVHVAAANNPAGFGGPFYDLPASSVPAVADHIASLRATKAEAIAFAEALRAFDTQLQSASGYSLDEQRERLPALLRGRVELVYDLNNNPKLKLLEDVLSLDDLGLRRSQAVLLHSQSDEERPFFLGSPRVGSVEGLILPISFDSAAMALLCRARVEPVNLAELAHKCGVSESELEPFFTTIRHAGNAPRFSGDGVRIRYFGHACLLIETTVVSILVDPTFAYGIDSGSNFTVADLPPFIDYVFISHGHQDHMCIEALVQLRGRVGNILIPGATKGEIADPSLKLMLQAIGFTNITVLDMLQAYPIPGGQLLPLPFSGEHCDLDIQSKQCVVLDLLDRHIGLFIDSDAIDIDVYNRISDAIGCLDLMFIGMECFGAPLTWLYGPLLSTPVTKRNDRSRRLSGANCARAWALTTLLNPSEVAVYAMGQEPWMRYLMGLNYTQDSVQMTESSDFVNKCIASGIPAERLYMKREWLL